jgi:hypothetical protein
MSPFGAAGATRSFDGEDYTAAETDLELSF